MSRAVSPAFEASWIRLPPCSSVVQRAVTFKTWFHATRPKTLAAAVVPVAVGTALAARSDAFSAIPALLCLGFALLIQIGTNFANDYFDFIKAADREDRIGPTRVVAAGLVSPAAMRRATIAAFVLAFLTGINLVAYGGWWLVGVGVASILFGLAYTAGPFPLAYNGLGDLFVLIFFGWIAVVFTAYVQAGFFIPEAWLAGTAVGALATNILVANNTRDHASDARAGKKTLVVRFGRGFALAQYAAALTVAAVVPIILLMLGYGPAILLPLLLTPSAVRLFLRFRSVDTPHATGPILGRSGALLLAYGLLFSCGLILS